MLLTQIYTYTYTGKCTRGVDAPMEGRWQKFTGLSELESTSLSESALNRVKSKDACK